MYNKMQIKIGSVHFAHAAMIRQQHHYRCDELNCRLFVFRIIEASSLIISCYTVIYYHCIRILHL